ncbi:MAG: tetratricopeptide repeat protein [Myxococcales bacterium]|nr:tetratricopeptide repeat protein [Myxococcales bacterium]
MRTSSRSSLCAALVVLAAASVASAQRSSDGGAAISLYDEGRRLFEAEQYDLACPKFDASLQLNPDDIDARGMLALCYERAGKLASAWAQFRELRVRAQRSNRAEPLRVADEHIAALGPRLAKVTIRISSTPGIAVLRDGLVVPPEAFGSGLAVDAGTLTFSAEAKGYQGWSIELEIKDGEEKAIDVPSLVPMASAEAGLETPAMTTAARGPLLTSSRWIAVGLAGAGLVSLGGGTWAGLEARSSRDAARELGCNTDLSMCPSAALDTANAAYSRGRLSTGLFIGGGALVGAATVVWFIAGPKERPPPVQLQPTISETSVGFAITGSL